jgi:paraquat-inducible protein B
VLVSIAFLTFAIFYDEVFKDDEDDNDNKKLDFVINSPLNGSEIQLFYIDEEVKNLTEKSFNKFKEIASNNTEEIHLNITLDNNFNTIAENRVNKTVRKFSEESLISILTEGKTLENLTKKLNITFENFINREFTAKLFSGKWISSNELLHYDSENNLCITTVPEMNKSVLIHNDIIVSFALI